MKTDKLRAIARDVYQVAYLFMAILGYRAKLLALASEYTLLLWLKGKTNEDQV